MDFKNDFEKKTFETCSIFLSQDRISLEHNYSIRTEKTIVSFTGNPQKEIDVLTMEFPNNVKLLVSCKDYGKNVPPAAIQEWGDVLKVLNKHSIFSTYFGLVVAARGFSKGCEAWAKTDNIGLIPPYRGERNEFDESQIFKMLQRVIHVFLKTIDRRGAAEIYDNEDFYWLCYKTVADL